MLWNWVRGGRRSKAKTLREAGCIDYPKWEVTRRKGYHTPAMSLTTHKALQEKLKNTERLHYRTTINEDFSLRGFLVCSSCDTRFIGS